MPPPSKQPISQEQCKDTGLAAVLILFILWLFMRRDGLVVAAMTVHVLTMIVPRIFQIPAIFWFGLSHVLGNLVSKILLSVIFITVVTPVGLIRQWLGKDSLQLKGFKTGVGSVMIERNHTFTGEDLEKPF